MLKSKLGFATAGVLAATLSMQSMASEVATVQAPLSVDELSFAFADVGSADVLAMSQGEMKETEGAVAPWVIGGGLGAVIGGAGYAHGVWRGNHKWSTNRFLGNVATGAVIGGSFGTAGSIASGGARFVPSLTNAGANIWRANSVTTNWGVNHAWRQSPVQKIQINHNTHQLNQLNQQMLNQNLYGDFQRFANTQQNFQIPRRMSCVSVGGSGMPPTCSYF